MLSDFELLEQFLQKGDEAAFEQLVNRHGPMMRGIGIRATGSESLAEEITQAVFTLLVRKGPLLSGQSLAGWLHRTTYLESRNHARKVARYRKVLTSYQEQTEAIESDVDRTEGEILQHLDRALARLKDDDRQMIILYYFENLQIDEIANAHGLSSHACRKRIQRALLRLERHLRHLRPSMAVTNLAQFLGGAGMCYPPASATSILSTVIAKVPHATSANYLANILHPIIAIMKTSTIIKASVAVIALVSIALTIRMKSEPSSVGGAGNGSDSKNEPMASFNDESDLNQKENSRRDRPGSLTENLQFPELGRRYGNKRLDLAKKVSADWIQLSSNMLTLQALDDEQVMELEAINGRDLSSWSPEKIMASKLESMIGSGYVDLNLDESQQQKILELAKVSQQRMLENKKAELDSLSKDQTPLLNLLLAADLHASEGMSEEEYQGILKDNRDCLKGLSGSLMGNFTAINVTSDPKFLEEAAQILSDVQSQQLNTAATLVNPEGFDPTQLEDLHETLQYAHEVTDQMLKALGLTNQSN